MRLAPVLFLVIFACDDKGGGDGDVGQTDGGGEVPCDTTWYADADGDGYGDLDTTEVDCDAPSGFVADATDCDDTDASVHPGADEYCDKIDTDCDGVLDNDALDPSTWYADADNDTYGDPDATIEACDHTYGYVENADDCDDADPFVAPGAPEQCDGVDNDCDGLTDDEDDDVFRGTTWYVDGDGDGFGVSAGAIEACDMPDGYADNELDCDDDDASVNPDTTWYPDADEDGYGDDDGALVICEPPSGTWLLHGGDCDDDESTVNEGGTEVCDGLDNDCNGDVDDDVLDPTVWYRDADGDGYGDPDSTKEICDKPSGYLADAGDCDDTDADAGPGGEETWYDGVDTDCDGESDYDADGDGYDSDDYKGTDCDDTDPSVSPAAEETCDGVDNDCDGDVDPDDSVDAETFYLDYDGDGCGDADSSTTACEAPSGYVDNDGDSDDSDADVADCTNCGDEYVDEDEGEEYDPPPGPYTYVEVDDETCRWDFSGVNQLYCNGACSWAGSSGCDSADADILCKLITGNPDSEADSWTSTTALAEAGFPCAPLGLGTAINIVDRGVDSVKVTWQDSSILATHGAGSVVAYPVCTDP